MLDLSDEKIAKLDALGPLIAKVTGAFLESRWSWPKRYSALTPFSFELTDPKADEVDVARLERLAEELQLKLFGVSGGGEVTLLLHDGDEADTASFLQMDHVSLKNAMREPLRPTAFGGRLLKITATGLSMGLHWRTLERATDKIPPGRLDDVGPACVDTTFRGVYFTPRRSFIGSAVVATQQSAEFPYSLVDGVEHLPGDHAEAFDMACLEAGRRHMAAQPFIGVMFLPICFSSLMRRSTRASYEQQLLTLPPEKKKKLAAAVYEVPRSPTFSALAQMHDVLSPHFAMIDLQIDDAGFEIDYVPQGLINSVTLRLPEGDERSRLAALHRFMDKQASFKRRQIWPAITNVRSRAELKACLQEKTPFITGSGVCGSMTLPIGNLAREPDRLPMTQAA
jgi:hypothetical protein